MNRRIRSSAPRGRAFLLCLALGFAATASACSSDLFHDTKWKSRCDTEPDAAICPQGTGGAGGTSSTGSSSSDATSASSASSSASSSSSSASSTTGAGGGTSTSTGTSMLATSSSTGP